MKIILISLFVAIISISCNSTDPEIKEKKKGHLMRKAFRLIVFILIFSQFVGCLYQVNRGDYYTTDKFNNKVNELCFEQDVRIVTTDSLVYSGMNFQISDSTSTFVDQNTGSEKVIPLKNIISVSFNSFSSGILKSLTAGIFASIALLMLWDTFKGENNDNPETSLLVLPIILLPGPVISFAVLVIDGYEIQINISKTN